MGEAQAAAGDRVSSAEKTPRYGSLQAGRGLAATAVAVQHSSTFAGVVPGLWVHPAIARWFMGFRLGVAFFFVLSGAVILMAHWKDMGRPGRVPLYLWKRFRRIYPIYWVVLGVVLCWQIPSARGAFAFRRDPWVVLSSVLLVHVHPGYETNLVVAWTLFVEVLFYAVFVGLLVNRRLGMAVLAGWMAMSVVNLVHRPMVMPMLFSRLHLLFGMGMAVAWVLRRGRVASPGVWMVLGMAVLAGSFVYGGWRGQVSDWVYLWAGAGTAGALLGAAEMEREGRLRTPRWLRFLGDASYSIYLVHQPVIAGAARVFFRADRHVHLPIGVWMALLAGMGVLAGCCVHVGVERPLLRWMGSEQWPAVGAGEPAGAAASG